MSPLSQSFLIQRTLWETLRKNVVVRLHSTSARSVQGLIATRSALGRTLCLYIEPIFSRLFYFPVFRFWGVLFLCVWVFFLGGIRL